MTDPHGFDYPAGNWSATLHGPTIRISNDAVGEASWMRHTDVHVAVDGGPPLPCGLNNAAAVLAVPKMVNLLRDMEAAAYDPDRDLRTFVPRINDLLNEIYYRQNLSKILPDHALAPLPVSHHE